MTLAEHKKHAFLRKPRGGKFHRNEIALLGAPCGYIQQLSVKIKKELVGEFRLGYADADHGSGSELPEFEVAYTDKINHHSLVFSDEHIEYQHRDSFNATDLVLINGNHFKGENQFVIIHPDKKDSLERKLDRLTNVRLIILTETTDEPWDFLKKSVEGYENIPVIRDSEIIKIARSVKEFIIDRKPVLKGLVLAGGKSTRMGRDKGSIDYHGKPQREYAADLLSEFCEEVFISVRADMPVESAYPQLTDSFTDLGPYGGILSALREDPDAAWLCVACDIPLLDKKTLDRLVEGRDDCRIATCFHNPETGFPEPLITIWEPRSYGRLLQFLAMGYSCPRKVLINSYINEIKLEDAVVLTNVNTPEEMEKVKKPHA